jgi:hypothetical protein
MSGLGDKSFNVGMLWAAHVSRQGMAFSPGLAAAQIGDPVGCLPLNNSALQEIKISAGNGFVCLPPAIPGKRVLIGNGVGQIMTLLPSIGSTDTINGLPSYAGMTGNAVARCFAVALGAWYCVAGS